VTTTGPLVARQPLTIVATGTNAPFDTPIDYGLRLFAIDHKLLPIPCAQGFSMEETIWEDNSQAGRLLTFEDLNEGLSGSFTISLPITLAGGGDLLICAYSVFVTDDVAWASDEVTVAASGTKPQSSARPRVTRSGGRLRCSPGSWSGSPTSYAYRWLVSGKAGTAGRGSSLSLTRKLRGHAVACSVTASNSTGSATAKSLPFRIS
jgi:hypothetical protein